MPPTVSRRTALATVAGLTGSALAGCRAPRQHPPGDFTVAVLPDTQHYSRLNNGCFEAQTNWIDEYSDAYGIETVLHLGDLVNNPAQQREWAVATDALGTLDDAGLPTLVACGNHDATTIRDPAEFRQYVPVARYATLARESPAVRAFGTFADHPENVWFRQRLAGRDWLFLALEFGPRATVVDWADSVLRAHDGPAVLITHSYLYFDDTRVDRGDDHNPRSYGLADVHNGTELWNALVGRHANLVAVCSGHHIPGHASRRIDRVSGAPVVQLFANYQTDDRGGDGWLRLLTVDTDRREIHVRTYSPVLDTWANGPAEEFTAPYGTGRADAAKGKR